MATELAHAMMAMLASSPSAVLPAKLSLPTPRDSDTGTTTNRLPQPQCAEMQIRSMGLEWPISGISPAYKPASSSGLVSDSMLKGMMQGLSTIARLLLSAMLIDFSFVIDTNCWQVTLSTASEQAWLTGSTALGLQPSPMSTSS